MLYEAEHPRLVDSIDGEVHVIEEKDHLRAEYHGKYYKNPIKMTPVFGLCFTKEQVRTSVDVEEWLMGVTGYKKIEVWSL